MQVNTFNDIQNYLDLLKKNGVASKAVLGICKQINDNAQKYFEIDHPNGAGESIDIEPYNVKSFNELYKMGIIPHFETAAPAENGPIMANKEPASSQNTFDNLPKQAEKTANGPDFATLRQYIDAGFTLFAKYTNPNGGACFTNWRKDGQTNTKDTAKIETLQDLETAINNGVNRFTFVPAERDFLCFDIDKGHANEIDGLQVFKDYFAQKGIDTKKKLATTWAETPSGGLHLYFKADLLQEVERTNTALFGDNGERLQNVEIRGKGTAQDLTAAGSIKNGRLYLLHGDIETARPLPFWLIKHITPKPAEQTPRTAKTCSTTTAGHNGKIPLDRLIDYVINDNPGETRNNLTYKMGLRIGHQYDFETILQEIRTRAELNTLPDAELKTALQSGINNSKH